MSSNTSIDSRINAFLTNKLNRSTADIVADLVQSKFGGRDAAVQNGETVVGMKYEPASRGKF